YPGRSRRCQRPGGTAAQAPTDNCRPATNSRKARVSYTCDSGLTSRNPAQGDCAGARCGETAETTAVAPNDRLRTLAAPHSGLYRRRRHSPRAHKNSGNAGRVLGTLQAKQIKTKVARRKTALLAFI